MSEVEEKSRWLAVGFEWHLWRVGRARAQREWVDPVRDDSLEPSREDLRLVPALRTRVAFMLGTCSVVSNVAGTVATQAVVRFSFSTSANCS